MTKILPIHIVGVHVIKTLINSQEDQLERKINLALSSFQRVEPKTFLLCCCLFPQWERTSCGMWSSNFVMLTQGPPDPFLFFKLIIYKDVLIIKHGYNIHTFIVWGQKAVYSFVNFCILAKKNNWCKLQKGFSGKTCTKVTLS